MDVCRVVIMGWVATPSPMREGVVCEERKTSNNSKIGQRLAVEEDSE